MAQWVLGVMSTYALKWTVVCRFAEGTCRADPVALLKGPTASISIQVTAPQTKWMALPEVQVEEMEDPPAHPTEEEVHVPSLSVSNFLSKSLKAIEIH